jgi:hypothetical protein
MTQALYTSLDDAISQVALFTEGRTLTQNAAEMGVTVDWLSRAINPREKPRCPAALIVPLTKTTQNFAVVRTICKLVGGVFFQPCRLTSHIKYEASTLKEFSEYLATLAKNEAGGFTTPEVDELENEMHDVISCMLAHVDKLRAEAK